MLVQQKTVVHFREDELKMLMQTLRNLDGVLEKMDSYDPIFEGERQKIMNGWQGLCDFVAKDPCGVKMLADQYPPDD